MAAASAFAPDPVESCVAEIVRAYGAWLKNPTSDVFESLGHRWHPVKSASSGVDITVRLTNLGFNAMLCPVVAGGDMRFDVWMRKSQRVDPASELGRMLGLPVPEPNPQTDKVQAVVRDINDQFSTWLLTNDYVPGVNSPVFSVQVAELSTSSRALLRRMMAAHGWHVGDLAGADGSGARCAFIRRVYHPCSCGGFAASQQQQQQP